MSSSSSSVTSSGPGFLGILCILFIGLKLTGHITWSWWWVMAPLWGSALCVLVIFLVLAIAFIVKEIFQ